MNRIITYLSFFLLIAVSGMSQEMVSLKGKISNPEADRIYIRNIKHYKDYFGFEKVYLASAPVDESGVFEISFKIERAIPLEINYGNDSQEIYIEPNYKLKVTVNAKKFNESIKFEGIGGEVNNFLVKYYSKFENDKELEKITKNIRTQSTSDFIEYVTKRKKDQQDFFESYFKTSTSAVFKNYVTSSIEYEKAGLLLQYFSYALRNNIPIDTSRYSLFQEVQLMNEKAITSSKYLNFLESYADFFYYLDCKERIRKGEEIDTVKMHYEIYKIRNNKFTESIRDLMLAKIIATAILSDNLIYIAPNIDKMLRHYKKINKNKNYFKLLLDQYRKVNKLAPGNPAPNFTYNDLKGNKVSLNDFKGKVVFVDVWASWCGKCRTELPHSEKLQEKFQGQDVVFINVSIDRIEKLWTKIIQEKNIQGINLITGKHFESQIVKDYNVLGIPHFILIDKDGKIVENRAKRPSQGADKDIEVLLNKK